MGGIAVPPLEGQHLSYLGIDELLRTLQPRVEPLHVPDLKFQPALGNGRLKRLNLFQADAKRFLAKHMFASRQRRQRRRNMKGIGGGDDHRIKLRIGQHRVIIRVAAGRSMGDRKPLDKVLGNIADGMQPRVAGLGDTFEMAGLRNRATAKNANIHRLVRRRIHRGFTLSIIGCRRFQTASRSNIGTQTTFGREISGKIVFALFASRIFFTTVLGNKGSLQSQNKD